MKLPGPGIRIAAVAVLAILGLIGLVARESFERAHGTEAILWMQAVDPGTLLSGSGVAITLQEPLAAGQPCPPGIAASGVAVASPTAPTLWIALAPKGDHAVAVGAAKERDAAAKIAPLVVRGRPTCVLSAAPLPGFDPTPGTLILDLGVGHFYASQAEAKRISGLTDTCVGIVTCPVAAIVSIGHDGRARLKGLMINGRRVELAPF